jgi:diguanylate cyclase (GGDEF)-like protein
MGSSMQERDPAIEAARDAALAQYRILDTLPERAYDDIAQIAKALAGTEFSAVTLIHRERQWLKARVGFEASETPRSTAICDTAIRSPDRVLVVPDARADARFDDYATVAGPPYIRFYAGAPMVNWEGIALGTVCVFDSAAGSFGEEQVEALQALARQVVHLLEMRARNRDLRRALFTQREQQQQLAQAQRELVSANVQLLREARQDALSGLMNRRALDELERRVDGGEFDAQSQYALLVLDVDHFKQINDSRGHAVGDEVIRALGAVIRAGVREEDLPFRLGGEEFGVFMPAADVEAAQAAARRIRSQCAQGAGLPFAVMLSGGIATARFREEPLAEALERADRALYRAKRAGRDRVIVAAAGD